MEAAGEGEVSRRLNLLGDEGKTDFAVGSVPRRFRIPRKLTSAGGLLACRIGIDEARVCELNFAGRLISRSSGKGGKDGRRRWERAI